jgi:hypothetical protein
MRRPKQIATKYIECEGKQLTVRVIASPVTSYRPEPMPSRNDANAPGQRFMRDEKHR